MKDHLSRLVEIAELLRAARLAELSRASEARDVVEQALRELGPAARRPGAAPAHPLLEAVHDGWRLRRKAALNLRLAAATAEWMERRDAAVRSLGRAEALRRLAQRK